MTTTTAFTACCCSSSTTSGGTFFHFRLLLDKVLQRVNDIIAKGIQEGASNRIILPS